MSLPVGLHGWGAGSLQPGQRQAGGSPGGGAHRPRGGARKQLGPRDVPSPLHTESRRASRSGAGRLRRPSGSAPPPARLSAAPTPASPVPGPATLQSHLPGKEEGDEPAHEHPPWCPGPGQAWRVRREGKGPGLCGPQEGLSEPPPTLSLAARAPRRWRAACYAFPGTPRLHARDSSAPGVPASVPAYWLMGPGCRKPHNGGNPGATLLGLVLQMRWGPCPRGLGPCPPTLPVRPCMHHARLWCGCELVRGVAPHASPRGALRRPVAVSVG